MPAACNQGFLKTSGGSPHPGGSFSPWGEGPGDTLVEGQFWGQNFLALRAERAGGKPPIPGDPLGPTPHTPGGRGSGTPTHPPGGPTIKKSLLAIQKSHKRGVGKGEVSERRVMSGGGHAGT